MVTKKKGRIYHVQLSPMNGELPHEKIFMKPIVNMSVIYIMHRSFIHFLHVKMPNLKCNKFLMTLMFPKGFVNIFACGSSPLS